MQPPLIKANRLLRCYVNRAVYPGLVTRTVDISVVSVPGPKLGQPPVHRPLSAVGFCVK